MNDVPVIQEMAVHEYLVRVSEGDDVIEIRLHTSPAVLTRIGGGDTAEPLIVEATMSYLMARQRADDLPTELDLDDVASADEGYVEDIRHRLAKS